MKKRLRKCLAVLLAVSLLAGCTGGGTKDTGMMPESSAAADVTPEGSTVADVPAADADSSAGQESMADSTTDSTADSRADSLERLYAGQRPFLVAYEKEQGQTVTANTAPYQIAPDLSNVTNLGQFYVTPDAAVKLAENGFVVTESYDDEFFQVYERNRYAMIPNFITVDSLMHSYHLYFSHLLKNIERDFLWQRTDLLSKRMVENSLAQYEALKGSEWEGAALRNLAFFTVGARLTDESLQSDPSVERAVETEMERIGQAGGIDICTITGDEEDYSQYIPRGYYAGDPVLEQYFQAMMWYGRIHFAQEQEELDRSALLITKALADDPQALELWESIYAVTSFFAGTSDDRGVYEYAPVMEQVYGKEFALQELIGSQEAFDSFHTQTAGLPGPRINSIPIWDGEDNEISGFRFMGQRFTVDGAIMQQLVYSKVRENSLDQKRMLPDVLDVPAVLGSQVARQILEGQGDFAFAGYAENMEKLQQVFAPENDVLWPSSLYSGWLNTLRPLLYKKGQGYPVFMQNKEWEKRDLECFAGSFTELKHDTVLYAKQIMAEMGGGGDEDVDDRGYVQPEPLVYERFMGLSEQTSAGLEAFGLLSEKEKENLERLTTIARQLMSISQKELADQPLTEEEYEFIRCYGGYLEHFWLEAVREEAADPERIDTREFPAAIVVDIATDPNGTVLEAATGNPARMLVAVQVDGKIKLASGSVYTFYQFPWPMEDRLTDSKWRQMMGLEMHEDGSYHLDERIAPPDWTQSYREQNEWD